MEIAQSKLEALQEYFNNPAKSALEFEGAGIDEHLQTIVKLLNAVSGFGVSIGITLYTASGIVTGNLIGSQTYFKKFGDSFVQAFESKFPDQDWSDMKKLYELKASGTEDSSGDEYSAPPQFIHLDGASLLRENGDLLTPSGSLWRGKISSVVGFTMGSMQRDV
jgi:hypothetical protein